MISPACRYLPFMCILLVCGCQGSNLNINDPLPDFTFYDQQNQPVHIHDYFQPGKLLLVHFWGAACCLEYSVPTMKAVAKIHQTEKYEHVTVISVNLDYSKKKVQRIIKAHGISHLLLNDPDDLFYKHEPKLENVFPLALILVVDEKGTIKKKIMGPQLLPAIAELIEKQ